jgi:hypothetical protein
MMGEDVRECLGPTEHHGLTLARLHRFGEKPGALYVEPDRTIAKALEHSLNTCALGTYELAHQSDGLPSFDARLVRSQYPRLRRG